MKRMVIISILTIITMRMMKEINAEHLKHYAATVLRREQGTVQYLLQTLSLSLAHWCEQFSFCAPINLMSLLLFYASDV